MQFIRETIFEASIGMSYQDDASPAQTAKTPAALHHIRDLYKRSTAIVLDYLVQNGRSDGNTSDAVLLSSELPVKDILTFASHISTLKIQVPDYIHSAFCTAILNRRKVTAWFHATEQSKGTTTEETEKHEYFNCTLERAFVALFPSSPRSIRTVEEHLSSDDVEKDGKTWSTSCVLFTKLYMHKIADIW